jgi:hypothetical protein
MADAGAAPGAGCEPTLAQLMDPAALERRLADARARRAVALAGRQGGLAARRGAEPPARRTAFPVLLERLKARPAAPWPWLPVFLAGLAAGLALALVIALVARPAPPPEVWHGAAATRLAPEPPRLALAGPSTRVVPYLPAALVPPGTRTALRPEPRPASVADARPAAVTRGRPAATPPEIAAAVLGDLNRATLGTAAATVGLRERVVLPGLTISLDRRGLRLKAHPSARRRH